MSRKGKGRVRGKTEEVKFSGRDEISRRANLLKKLDKELIDLEEKFAPLLSESQKNVKHDLTEEEFSELLNEHKKNCGNDLSKEAFTALLNESQTNFEHDLTQVSNFRKHRKICNSIEFHCRLSISHQMFIEYSRQMLLFLISVLHGISDSHGTNVAKAFSVYSQIRMASESIRKGLVLLINSPLKSYLDKNSEHTQPFSKKVTSHEYPKYLSYIPAFWGVSRIIFNRDFLWFFQEEFRQSPYALYGVGLVLMTDVLSYYFANLLERGAIKANEDLQPLTRKEIVFFDPIEETLQSLSSASNSILFHSVLYVCLVLVVISILRLPFFSRGMSSFFESESFDSSYFVEEFSCNFISTALASILISRFYYSLVLEKQTFHRLDFVRKFSEFLNLNFKKFIYSTVETVHKFIHVKSSNGIRKSTFRFFSLSLNVYCEVDVTAEMDDQFLLTVFKQFDIEKAVKKIRERFEVHNQLFQITQSINWKYLSEKSSEESKKIELEFIPFDGDGEISWFIELQGFDRSIQKTLKEKLIHLYHDKNENLEINIENSNLVIHGLKSFASVKKVGRFIEEVKRKNTWFDEKTDDSDKKSKQGDRNSFSESDLSSSNPKWLSNFAINQFSESTGEVKCATAESSENDKALKTPKKPSFSATNKSKKDDRNINPSQKDSVSGKSQNSEQDATEWEDIKKRAQYFCKQAREELSTNAHECNYKGGDPSKDAFFALVKTKDTRPEYIACVVWAQNLTSENVEKIKNQIWKDYFTQLLKEAQEEGYVTISRRTRASSSNGIIPCIEKNSKYSYKSRLSGGGRCGIALVDSPLSLFSSDKSNRKMPVRLGLMKIEDCFSHQQFERKKRA